MRSEKKTSFWSLPIGTRFDDGETMWSFVKVGWFTAKYYQIPGTVFVWPWSEVRAINSN